MLECELLNAPFNNACLEGNNSGLEKDIEASATNDKYSNLTISMAPQKVSSPYNVDVIKDYQTSDRTYVSLGEMEVSDRKIGAIDKNREITARSPKNALR